MLPAFQPGLPLAVGVLAAGLAALPPAPAALAADAIPAALRPYISELRTPTEFVALSAATVGESETPFRPVLSREEALADLAVLRHLFETAYSGRDYWAGRGVAFAGLYADLEKAAMASEKVDMAALETLIAERLKGIRDGHLGIAGRTYHSFREHQDAYFADVVLERRRDRYVVVASTCRDVATGSVHGGPASELFPTLSPTGKEHRLLGMLAARPSRRLATTFDGKPASVPLHRARIAAPEDDGSDAFGRYEAQGIPVLRVRSFSSAAHETLSSFVAAARDLKTSRAFILDVSDNGGGSSIYAQNFFQELGGEAHWRKATALLESPAIAQSWAALDASASPPHLQEVIREARDEVRALRAGPERSWKVYDDAGPQRTGSYPGQVVVIANSRVASSGEATIAYARSVKQCVLVGENSAGIGTFGEILQFKLPHSGLKLFLPSKIFLMPDSLEGVGSLPDLWLDSARPVAEVARWLARPERYAYLPPPPTSLKSVSLATFRDGAPAGMRLTIGASEKEGPASRVELDPAGGATGGPCLRLSANAATGRFYSVGVPVPPDVDRVKATWRVKGQGISVDGHRFANCWIGFTFRDAAGRRQFHVESYDGTFDWKTGTAELDIAGLEASEARFGIFLSQSGDLWVDGLECESRPEP